MINLFILVYLLCGLALYGLMMWAITTGLNFTPNTIHGVITDGISSVDIGISVVKFKQDDLEVGGKCD